ncbi:MAG: hypothetical protein ALECFALPRED_010821 [Alectoria fallacina]|uniref:Uncharacterized protein n=1 Tax=Alectoria fallacina TaxID=1903189 RepID=A0A8H3F452_9LECA|nr:MAG: hypothetical protein ALECFALPRED_010821 [Alectoria fallacina]
MASTTTIDIDLLYQQLDHSLARIQEKDKELTTRLKDIHYDLKAALYTSNGIEKLHSDGLAIPEDGIASLKEAKKYVRTVRDEMKDLFDLLFVDDWPDDPERGDSGKAETVHQ